MLSPHLKSDTCQIFKRRTGGIVKAIAARGTLDIAKRALQTTGQVFRYRIANGLAQHNPAAGIKPGDVLPSRKAGNYFRLASKELPELLRHQGLPQRFAHSLTPFGREITFAAGRRSSLA